MKLRVVVSGRHYHWTEGVPETLELPGGSTVAAALAQIAESLSNEGQLPGSCLVALGGKHLGSVSHYQDAPLSEGDELVLIAPVAGG